MAHSSHPLTGSLKGSNPDRGPKIVEGAHHFDKGYESDQEVISAGEFPDGDYRGNKYPQLQKEIRSKDEAKLKRSKFSKVH